MRGRERGRSADAGGEGSSTGGREPGGPEGSGEPVSRRLRRRESDRGVMIPVREGRSRIETLLMRLVATAGIIGIGVAIAAIMASQKSHGWLIGLVVSGVTVILAAILWSSRRL